MRRKDGDGASPRLCKQYEQAEMARACRRWHTAIVGWVKMRKLAITHSEKTPVEVVHAAGHGCIELPKSSQGRRWRTAAAQPTHSKHHHFWIIHDVAYVAHAGAYKHPRSLPGIGVGDDAHHVQAIAGVA